MNSHWQSLLELLNSPIAITNDEYSMLNNLLDEKQLQVADEQQVLCPMPDYGLLLIEGKDAQNFLQGQLSCDMKQVSKQRPLFACYNTIKGRVLATMHVQAFNSGYSLILPLNTLETIQTTLQKYALFSKVSFSNLSDTHACFAEIKTMQLEKFLIQPFQQVDYLDKGYSITSNEFYKLYLIYAGIVTIDSAVSDTFTPHDVNLQLTNAISFTKGCYLGQEIIARMHYRATLKKHLYHLRFSVDKLNLGQEIKNEQQQVLGHIINYFFAENKHAEVLAVLKDSALDDTSFYLDSSEVSYECVELPYGWD